MIAPASQPGLLEPPDAWAPPALPAPPRWGQVAALLLGFFAFLPYPAIPFGHNSALQMGDVLCLIMVLPVMVRSWRRPFYLAMFILIPLTLSAVRVAVAQESGLDTCLKSAISWSLSCMTLFTALYYFPRYPLQMMTGIALVMLLHVGIGAWQMYAFQTGGELPLLGLYINPSYLSVQDQAKTIEQYIQRPFGLFPEPSAMSSSLAPWVLLWFAELCGLVKFAARPARWQRVLFAVAAAGALLLIIISRSGHAMATLLVLVVFGLAWLKRAKATPKNYLLVTSVFGLLLPLVIWLAVLAVGDRVSEISGNNESWQDRSASLLIGFQLWTGSGLGTLIFGMGSGLCSVAMQERYGLEAVWSVLLTYVYETGIAGAISVIWTGQYLVRIWRRTNLDLVFGGYLFVWLVGVTVTTSYNQLQPIWIALGFLIVWPKVCMKPGSGPAGRVISSRQNQLGFEAHPTTSTGLAVRSPADEELAMTPWSRHF